MSGIDLDHELTTAARAAGLSSGDIQKAQENALEIAFIEPDERRALVERAR